MTFQIENLVRERLSQVKNVRIVPCKHCGTEIIHVKTRIGGIVPLDLELKRHKCKKREERGGNYGRL